MESIDEIYNIVDKERLLTEHGGELEFNPEDWVSKHEKDEESEDNFDSLHHCIS